MAWTPCPARPRGRPTGRRVRLPQAAGGTLGSRIVGNLPTLTVATDIAGAQVIVIGKIGSVFVGGTDAGLLGHLRGEGPHWRGCFALDAVLGRS